MANNQKADISDVTARRTKRLEKLFRDCSLPIRIIGEVEKPVFVYNEVAFLSMYVKNFELRIKLNPNSKEEIASVKIRLDHGMTNDKFMDLFKHSTHNAVIKIQHDFCPLCVSGYNFLDRNHSKGRYPVFARYGHKAYFNAKYVAELVEELKTDEYPVHSWIPALESKQELAIVLDEEL